MYSNAGALGGPNLTVTNLPNNSSLFPRVGNPSFFKDSRICFTLNVNNSSIINFSLFDTVGCGGSDDVLLLLLLVPLPLPLLPDDVDVVEIAPRGTGIFFGSAFGGGPCCRRNKLFTLRASRRGL